MLLQHCAYVLKTNLGISRPAQFKPVLLWVHCTPKCKMPPWECTSKRINMSPIMKKHFTRSVDLSPWPGPQDIKRNARPLALREDSGFMRRENRTSRRCKERRPKMIRMKGRATAGLQTHYSEKQKTRLETEKGSWLASFE